MVTNDERRDVAAKLRFNACTALHMNTSDDFAREVFRATMNEAIGDYQDAINRLADLIEPEPERTCEMVDNGRELCCSVCDWRHDYDDEPVYCSGCGAKVVEE